MAEALWSQNSGVEYSAAEDRRLINAIWLGSTGVLNGLVVSAGTGRTVNVSSGRAIVPDGAGGAYLAYFDATTSDVALAANTGAARTDGVYVVVDDPGDGSADIVVVTADTPVPTKPYVKLATVVVGTNATTPGTITDVRATVRDTRYALDTKFTYGTAAPAGTLPVGNVYMQHQ